MAVVNYLHGFWHTTLLLACFSFQSDAVGAEQKSIESSAHPTRIVLFSQEILDRDGLPAPETRGMKSFMEFFRREANIEFDLQRLPWRRAQNMVLDGRGIIWGFSKNSERLYLYRFSEAVMHSKIWAIAYGEPAIKIEKLEDLRGKTVSVERGVSHGMVFDEARKSLFRVDEDTASAAARFRKLMAKRSDVLLWGLVQFDKPSELLNYLHSTYIPNLHDASLNGVRFYSSNKPMFLDSIHFAAKKGYFEDEMVRIDRAIQKGLVSGELSQILRQM